MFIFLRTDVYVTGVNKRSSQIVPVSLFLQALDLKHDQLRNAPTPIDLASAIPAEISGSENGNYFNGRESFDTAFAGLVALVVLLCMGVAAILIVCCCLSKL